MMNRFWSAKFNPGPEGHQQTQPVPLHDHLRTLAAAETEHIIGILFWRVAHKPFWVEPIGIGVYGRVVADLPVPSMRSVRIGAFRRNTASPNVDDYHSTFGDQIPIICIVFHGRMRYPYRGVASTSVHQTPRYHSPSGPTTPQRLVSLITASKYGRRLPSAIVGRMPSPNVRESSSRALLYTSGNIVIARKKEARVEDN